MKNSFINLLFSVVLILYPFAVFVSRKIFFIPVRYISIFIIAFAACYALASTVSFKETKKISVFFCPFILLCLGIVCIFANDDIVLKLYPALADVAYLVVFAFSLIQGPPIIYLYVVMFDKLFHTRMDAARLDHYCRTSTFIFCVFFVVDLILALVTVFWVPPTSWKLNMNDVWWVYNGIISYFLMGLLAVLAILMYKSACKLAGKEGGAKKFAINPT